MDKKELFMQNVRGGAEDIQNAQQAEQTRGGAGDIQDAQQAEQAQAGAKDIQNAQQEKEIERAEEKRNSAGASRKAEQAKENGRLESEPAQAEKDQKSRNSAKAEKGWNSAKAEKSKNSARIGKSGRPASKPAKAGAFGFYDLLFLLFFSSRLLTYLFVQAFGNRAVFYHIALMGLLMVIAIIKGLFFDKNRGVLLFVATVFGVLTFSLGTLHFVPTVRPWLFGRTTGIYTQLFDPRRSGIFAILLFSLLHDPERIMRDLNTVAFFRLAYCIYQIFLYSYTGDWSRYFTMDTAGMEGLYNMSIGYELILPALVFTLQGLRRKSWLYTLLGAIAIGLSVFFGSRGVLVILIGFCLMLILFEVLRDHSWKEFFKRFLATALVVGLILTIIPFLNAAIFQAAHPEENMTEAEKLANEEKLKALQTSRTLAAMQEGELTESNGRLNIWKISFDAFKKSPIYGHGMYGDRPYVGMAYKWGYSHNILFEFLATFGLIGAALLIFLAILVIRALWRRKTNPYYDLILLSMASSMKLLVSDSFWFHVGFFSLIASLYLYYRTQGLRHVFHKEVLLSQNQATLSQNAAVLSQKQAGKASSQEKADLSEKQVSVSQKEAELPQKNTMESQNEVNLSQNSAILFQNAEASSQNTAILSQEQARAEARYQQLPWKGQIIGTLVLLAMTLGFAYIDISQGVREQDFKTIAIQEPTVVFNFTAGKAYDYRCFQDLQQHAPQVKCNVFLPGRMVNRSGYLSRPMIREMQEKGWEFQDNTFDYRGSVALRQEERAEQYEKTEKYFADLGLPDPTMIFIPFSSTNMSVQYQAQFYRKVAMTETETAQTNRLITKPELANLKSVDIAADRPTIFMDEEALAGHEQRHRDILSLIDRTAEKGGLLILSTSADRPDYPYLQKVFQRLTDRGYQFMTMDQLLEQSAMQPQDKSLKNWLQNTYLMDIVYN